MADRKRPPIPRTWILLFAGFLGVAILLEGGARLLSPRLEEPLRWYHWRAQRVVQAMEIEAASGRRSHLVFAGNSAVGHAMDPRTFQDEMPAVQRAHNVALPAADTRLLERWLLDEVVPRLRPERVVLGLTSQDVNTNRQDPAFRRYREAPAGRHGLVASLERFLVRHSVLARYRATLRSPSAIYDALRGVQPTRRGPPVESALTAEAPDDFNKTRRELRRVQRGPLFDFVVGQEALDALRRTLEGMVDQEIDVVVVFVPMPPSYRDAHPAGAKDSRAALRAMRSVARSVGVPTVDLSNSEPEEAFKDYTHLWSLEAVDFSRRLARRLQALGL